MNLTRGMDYRKKRNSYGSTYYQAFSDGVLVGTVWNTEHGVAPWVGTDRLERMTCTGRTRTAVAQALADRAGR